MFITEKELATRQMRSVKTIRNQRTNGTGVPFTKFGASVRYALADVEAWEAAHRFVSTSEAQCVGGSK